MELNKKRQLIEGIAPSIFIINITESVNLGQKYRYGLKSAPLLQYNVFMELRNSGFGGLTGVPLAGQNIGLH